MKKLDVDDKKASTASPADTSSNVLTLASNDQAALDQLSVRIPDSAKTLEMAIEDLETEKTAEILRHILNTFPCNQCLEALRCGKVQIRELLASEHHSQIDPPSEMRLNLFGKSSGDWKVLLSPKAYQSLQDKSRSGLFATVQEKLSDLIAGCWNKARLIRAPKTRDMKIPLRVTACKQDPQILILWQVDIGISERLDVFEQNIRVWEVGDRKECAKAADRALLLQSDWTWEKISQCNQRYMSNGKQLPARFTYDTTQQLMLLQDHQNSARIDIRAMDEETIAMANKFYAYTEPVIRSIVQNDLSAEFPFDMSRDEIQVVEHFETSSLILGRSGTGKTTCLVFKLVGKYLAREAMCIDKPLRQILLTRSNFLAKKLKDYTSRLIQSLSSKSMDMMQNPDGNDPLTSKEDEDSINTTVLDLKDQHFPLVCTFDQFLTILDNTVSASNRGHSSGTKSKKPRIRQLIDFSTFKLDYWPQFPQSLTKGLSAALVFADIMGVIKGSITSSASLEPLSRDDYVRRSFRQAPAFILASDREQVYDLYEKYESLKEERDNIDFVDRVGAILNALRTNETLREMLGQAFHEIYIDVKASQI